jgi:hypothetical protein
MWLSLPLFEEIFSCIHKPFDHREHDHETRGRATPMLADESIDSPGGAVGLVHWFCLWSTTEANGCLSSVSGPGLCPRFREHSDDAVRFYSNLTVVDLDGCTPLDDDISSLGISSSVIVAVGLFQLLGIPIFGIEAEVDISHLCDTC